MRAGCCVHNDESLITTTKKKKNNKQPERERAAKKRRVKTEKEIRERSVRRRGICLYFYVAGVDLSYKHITLAKHSQMLVF